MTHLQQQQQTRCRWQFQPLPAARPASSPSHLAASAVCHSAPCSGCQCVPCRHNSTTTPLSCSGCGRRFSFVATCQSNTSSTHALAIRGTTRLTWPAATDTSLFCALCYAPLLQDENQNFTRKSSLVSWQLPEPFGQEATRQCPIRQQGNATSFTEARQEQLRPPINHTVGHLHTQHTSTPHTIRTCGRTLLDHNACSSTLHQQIVFTCAQRF